MTKEHKSKASQEKNKAALSSVFAAVGLTLMKIIVGVLTGSLGILAEAAHSGLDLVAALVTFFAVQISGKAPDKQHHFGHGKVENLSALFETLLLLATSVWIIYEAVQRLFFKSVEMEISIWAFLVMIVSIVIDFTRSRMLLKAAKKYKSQALEADALHFSTDIWSSSVVILGLILVKLSEYFPKLAFMAKADAVAAMAVALIVVYVSVQMGIKTVMGLLDSAPAGIEDRIKEIVNAIPDVQNCHAVRVRESGPHLFVDIHIELPPRLTVKTADAKTDLIEAKIKEEYPDLDITIHVEPASV
jgi:cation diffusion facilitator family transporter